MKQGIIFVPIVMSTSHLTTLPELPDTVQHTLAESSVRRLGISFPEFLLESRLLHAKQLLATTNLSIKQITLETGFSQSSYFIRCFKTQENVTPMQFRMMHNHSL